MHPKKIQHSHASGDAMGSGIVSKLCAGEREQHTHDGVSGDIKRLRTVPILHLTLRTCFVWVSVGVRTQHSGINGNIWEQHGVGQRDKWVPYWVVGQKWHPS